MDKPKRSIIESINISKKFGYFIALKKISFEVKQNTVFAIVGANGAGKTTLIKIISGILKPTHGIVNVNGIKFDSLNNEIKHTLGIMTDVSYLYDELTIHENLKFYFNLFSNFDNNKLNTLIENYANLFNLTDWIHEPVYILSKGMKKKVEIIRVLITHPAIILLDEPFSGLDFKSVLNLLDLIRDLKQKHNSTIIFTTHKIDIAMKLCDEIMILKRSVVNKILNKDDFNKEQILKYF